jgi:two-component system cell cycle response regulator DivK
MPLCIIVEDHADTLEGYAEFLGFEGLTVHTASNGDELHGLIGRETPDAIVMDLHLPSQDGGTLIRELKMRESTRDVPVLVVSASVREIDRREAFDAGCDAFIGKPCDPRNLLAELRRLMRERGERRGK